jgi:hemerythrin-like domain-containing protein
MADAPNLLNDDGSASMATLLMMSHHAFRRDIASFAVALQQLDAGDVMRLDALRDEWRNYRGALHGHHEMEDSRIFPHLAAHEPSLAGTIERLKEDHQQIEPLLGRGDDAFAVLPKTESAMAVVAELSAFLGPHLATEEAQLVPFLREAREFPAPSSEAEVELYAQGFAWSMHGIAAFVIEKVQGMLPEALLAKLPAAQAAFRVRCERAWGSSNAGAASTPIPDAPS